MAATLCLPSSPAGAQDEARQQTSIDEHTVVAVAVAVAQNPSLSAALSDVHGAQLLEEAEGHRYPLTLVLDGKARRDGAPALDPSGVTFPESTIYSMGGELRKKLVWGTDLSLRLEATRQTSSSIFTYAAPGSAPTHTLFVLGPGYGGSVRLG